MKEKNLIDLKRTKPTMFLISLDFFPPQLYETQLKECQRTISTSPASSLYLRSIGEVD